MTTSTTYHGRNDALYQILNLPRELTHIVAEYDGSLTQYQSNYTRIIKIKMEQKESLLNQFKTAVVHHTNEWLAQCGRSR